jgi:hypothetical protein
MTIGPPIRGRRTSLIRTAAVMSVMSVMPAISTAQAAPSRSGRGCPAAESLVPGTTWHNHSLAPGVTLSQGQRKDSNGVVKMFVLRVDLTTKGVAFSPLLHSLAQRSPLSKLVTGRKHLVAAVNTGYFDFFTGAPLDPLIAKKAPLVISDKRQSVIGLGTNNRWQSGMVRLRAAMFAGRTSHLLAGVNVDKLNSGIAVYTSLWGSSLVATRWGSVYRQVVGNKIQAAGNRGSYRGATVPSNGYLLVAKGQAAEHWLSAIATGTKIGIAATTKTTAPHPFVQAYGVGAEIVQRPGVVRTGLSCSSANTKQPARTAIGYADHGRKLVIAEVDDHPGTPVHGLDEDQMSKLMVQLGVGRAYDLDGSGSTELLARMPGASSLSLRTYPADGVERRMPVGLGIFSTKVG